MAATKIKLLLVVFVFMILLNLSEHEFAVAKLSQGVVEAEFPSMREEKKCYKNKGEFCEKDWHCCTDSGCFITWCV